jgi:8-oxo-dGTP diphosphatase
VPPPKTPFLSVDVVILVPGDRVVLIERRHEPRGWALPGGFVDVGEPLEAAAVREAKEETGLDVRLLEQFRSYSEPRRDPRGHTVSTVFIGTAEGEPAGADDAVDARAYRWDALPPLVFDHPEILGDVRRYLLTGARRRP